MLTAETFDTPIVVAVSILAYLAALIATPIWRALRARRIWRRGATMPVTKLSAYELALMNDGTARVALTGTVRLIGRGALTAGIAGVIQPSPAFAGELDPIEQEALVAAGKPSVLKDFLTRLEWQLWRTGAIARMRTALVTVGYMRKSGSLGWWANYLLNMLPFLIIIAGGLYALARLSLTDDASDCVTLFTGASAATMLLVAWPLRVTPFGRYIIWSATQHHPDLKTARATEGEAIEPKRLGQSVALYGPHALDGSDMAWIPAVLDHVSSD